MVTMNLARPVLYKKNATVLQKIFALKNAFESSRV